MDRWQGRVAVVTGASEGIGEAIVRELARNGMKVVALARRKELLEALEKDVNVKSPGAVRSHVCDVSNEEQVKATFVWIQKNVGPVSVLVNNAAVFQYTSLDDLDTKIAKSTIDTNIMGVLYCCQQGIASMKANNINDGHIININSVLGHRQIPMVGVSIYTATKHAITSLSVSLRAELKADKYNTRVTSISPGLVKTSMSNWYTEKNLDVPALTSSDIANGVLYALSVPAHVNLLENDVKVKSPGAVHSHVCDVSNEEQVKTAFDWIQKNVGPVSVLINNAAVLQHTTLDDLDTKIAKSSIDTNIMGVLYCCQQAIASMKANSINDGHIININSIVGHMLLPLKGISIYTATKHAITSLSASLRAELTAVNYNTRVTSISPGLVKTSMSNWYTEMNPDASALTASDIANGVLYALSVPAHVNVSELTLEPTGAQF